MNFQVTAYAEAYMEDAAEFYDAQSPGLGDRFLGAVQQGFSDIQEHPKRWPVFSKRVRRRITHTFPYGILYRIDGSEITVIAVMHMKRSPNFWARRIRNN